MRTLKQLGLTLVIVATLIGGLLLSPILAAIATIVVIAAILTTVTFFIYAWIHDSNLDDE
jgi:FtsH-binding integral membrane protein